MFYPGTQSIRWCSRCWDQSCFCFLRIPNRRSVCRRHLARRKSTWVCYCHSCPVRWAVGNGPVVSPPRELPCRQADPVGDGPGSGCNDSRTPAGSQICFHCPHSRCRWTAGKCGFGGQSRSAAGIPCSRLPTSPQHRRLGKSQWFCS